MGNIKKNLGYQTLYQILSVCLPLITAPYLSRTLGAESLGIFSYTQSIVNYFLLFAMLGVTNYGTRTIASCINRKKEIGIQFWSIYFFQAITSIFLFLLYLLYCFFLCRDNKWIALIQGVYLLGAFSDINWLFFGVEKFEITVKINIIIKLITVILIMTLVKTAQDLWIYTVIMAVGTFLSQAVLWLFVSNIIEVGAIRDIKPDNVLHHIKPNLILFVPIAAMSVFHTMDKTMLGLFSDYTNVGYYYNTDKIINIPLCIINGIGIVMFPRMSVMESIGDKKKAADMFDLSLQGIMVMSCAMAFGIAAVANEFVPVFFGKGYEPCIVLTIIFVPVLIFKALSQTVRMQYLIPKHMEKFYIYAVILGALVNLVANYILIHRYGALGAVIATIIAEAIVVVLQFIFIRKTYNLKWFIKSSWIYIAFGIAMFWIVRMIAERAFNNSIFSLLIEILIGAGIYTLLCVIYWKVTKNTIWQWIIKKK